MQRWQLNTMVRAPLAASVLLTTCTAKGLLPTWIRHTSECMLLVRSEVVRRRVVSRTRCRVPNAHQRGANSPTVVEATKSPTPLMVGVLVGKLTHHPLDMQKLCKPPLFSSITRGGCRGQIPHQTTCHRCWKTSPQRYHVMRLVRGTSWQESDQSDNFDHAVEVPWNLFNHLYRS